MANNVNELRENLISILENKKTIRKRKTVQSIKTGLKKYDLLNIQQTLNNPREIIPDLEPRELILLSEQIYIETESKLIKPSIYFSEYELKRARQFRGTVELDDEITFPYTFSNVDKIDKDTYYFQTTSKELARLSLSRKLHYNFNIQRESEKKNMNGQIIEEIKIVKQNVIQIKNNIINGKQHVSMIMINAAVFSADEGLDELTYDSQERKLTVNEGTILDMLDGYHRQKGSELAYAEDKNAEAKFLVLLTNYPDEKAKDMQGQHALATPIAIERREHLLNNKKANEVLDEFLDKSPLKAKVSFSEEVNTDLGELISFSLLRDTIENYFSLERRGDIYQVAEYLEILFEVLLEDNSFEEKLNNKQIINTNAVMVTIIILAKRMMENNIKAYNILNYIDKIDFTKNNPVWSEYKIINRNKLADNYNEGIEKFVDELI